MKEVTVQELKRMMDSGEDFQLIDVREPAEYEESNIGGTLIPLGDVIERMAEFSKDKKVVVHCRSGMRSATAINALIAEGGFDNLYNLKGGILAYANEIGL
ncbi:MAG: rhodanese-like domain-containing protein [Bacteroidia bacterium]